ncbi:MAG TPA: hypothetical protein VGD67_17995 [Pseudonocardiaceae bacterium]
MTVAVRPPVLAGLAQALDGLTDWQALHAATAAWVAARPDLLGGLRAHLRSLTPAERSEVAAGSRETTTHFAWRLLDQPQAAFSVWLHEYKPGRDWWPGYANTVHNHRYHFSSTVLAGGFQHEWYDVRLDHGGERVHSVSLVVRERWGPGPTRSVTADRFHRVPRALDGTLTFLVKSRPVRGWSLSVDPATGVSRRHVPVEGRIGELADRI